MPQVKVYSTRDTIQSYRGALSEGIHAAMVEAIGIPPGKPYQWFIPLDPENFVHPPDRTEQYVLIEIHMFTGRSAAAKKQLIRAIYAQLTSRTPILPSHIEIILVESPPENWGIKGQPGDEVKLSYQVNV